MSVPLPVYLDHNATTPVAPEVAAAMQTCLTEAFGDPSSDYGRGRRAAASDRPATRSTMP